MIASPCVATTRAQVHSGSSGYCPGQSGISTDCSLIVQDSLRLVLITSPCVGTTHDFCSFRLFSTIVLGGLDSVQKTAGIIATTTWPVLIASPCVATTHAQVHSDCSGYCPGQSGISTGCGLIVQDTLRLVLITSPCVGTTRDFALPVCFQSSLWAVWIHDRKQPVSSSQPQLGLFCLPLRVSQRHVIKPIRLLSVSCQTVWDQR